ncbi:MAG TPA: sodium:proton antiporter, partial [Chloroflexota bacterium]|nr:sodium:proton antiporter [Chloroflexota bacterium]
LLVGGMLTLEYVAPEGWWFVPLLLLIIRPLSVAIGLFGSTVSQEQLRLMSWFGIRGVGSVYYLTFAIVHGLPVELAERLTAITLTTVAVSIVVHGISVTPLMDLYERHARWRLRVRRARGALK